MYTLTESWSLPLIFLLLVPDLWCGALAGRHRYLDTAHTEPEHIRG